MDTPTQIVLGAAVGQAVAGHRLGHRAVIFGALGGLLPDLDMIPALIFGAPGEFLLHRGPTHSLLVGLALGPIVGTLVWKAYRRRGPPGQQESLPATAEADRPTSALPLPGDSRMLRTWIILFLATILTHPLLDLFTTYGTQLFWPISCHRFALNGVGIVDPAYTLALTVGLILGWRIRPARGRAVAIGAVAITTAYVLLGWGLNRAAEREAVRQLQASGAVPTSIRVRAYPTVGQLFLRRLVARGPETVRVGVYSFLAPRSIVWQVFTPDRHPLVDRVLATRLGRLFRWFAMDQLAPRVIQTRDGFTVEIDDIRYGIPGSTPGHGLWGIRERFDREGRRLSPVERFRRPLPAPFLELLQRLWLYLKGTQPAELSRGT